MSLVWIKDLKEETRLGIWKIEEGETELKNKLILNEKESAFFEDLKKGKRTLHWMASRVLLRKLLSLKKGEFLDTQLDEHEKPYILNKSFHFSLSHSFGYAAAIVSPHHLVGCDIEQIQEKILRIADKFLSEDEINFISQRETIKHLYACWSAKEAIYKLYGKKTISFKNHIHLHPFHISDKGEINASLQKDRFFKNLKVDYQVIEDYMLAYVVD